jgi:hypothetical protein
MSEPLKRKRKAPPPTLVERRLMEGASIIKTADPRADLGAYYTFADTGRAARYDIVERLIQAGKLQPQGDGLFGESQTWRLA